jgi:hypothetical protein
LVVEVEVDVMVLLQHPEQAAHQTMATTVELVALRAAVVRLEVVGVGVVQQLSL